MALTTPPLSLYVHFPWCVRKCPYCDFNSHTLHGELPATAYLEALTADLDAQCEAVRGRELVSVFMGGGTPSLFPPAAIETMLAQVRRRMVLSPQAEITLEANPGTIERGRFAEYRAAGVTRVSLGAQSFGSTQLAALGRIHSADETRVAAAELHHAGLHNFNLDLMVGLPGQDAAMAMADVQAAVELAPAHISHYALTLEPGTVFGSLPPAGLPDDDQAADMHEHCQDALGAAGYVRYETSAYARSGQRCLHNLNYWQFGDYLGIGAGAHGKRTDAPTGRIERTTREREPRRYIARGAHGIVNSLVIRESELPFEFMMNALRLIEGFDSDLYEQRTGLPIGAIASKLEHLRARGLIESMNRGWRPTVGGVRFLNEALLEFMDMPRTARPGPGRKTSDGVGT
jgi:oxygen-independent coproporphyrinogen-3 oxidase